MIIKMEEKKKKETKRALQDYCNRETSCATEETRRKDVYRRGEGDEYVYSSGYKRETMQSRRKQIYDPIK